MRNGHAICDRCGEDEIPSYHIESEYLDMFVCQRCGIIAEGIRTRTPIGSERPAGALQVTKLIEMIEEEK